MKAAVLAALLVPAALAADIAATYAGE